MSLSSHSKFYILFFLESTFKTIVSSGSAGSKISSSSQNSHLNDETTASMYDEAKSREVSPKLVVRGKKYGRRSRPQSVAPFESSQSDSEEDYDFSRVPTADEKSKTYHKVSVFAMEYFQNTMLNNKSTYSSSPFPMYSFSYVVSIRKKRSNDLYHRTICMRKTDDVYDHRCHVQQTAN